MWLRCWQDVPLRRHLLPNLNGGDGLPTGAITASPEARSQEQSFLSSFQVAGWLDRGSKFAVVLSGSSSCPAFPTSIEVLSAQHIKLEVETREAQACTADMAPRTYVIMTPSEVNVASEVTLEYGDAKIVLPPL